MNVVPSFYLRCKNWQLFLLFFGLFLAAGFVLATLWFHVVVVVSAFCILGWYWSLGLFLNSIGPPGLRQKVGFFRFALIYPALYMLVFMAFSQGPKLASLAIVLPLHLLAMFCMFYALYFVSKCLVLAETSKPASFRDYAGEFFLIWFCPIGVWFIQPRVNRLHAQRRASEQTL